MILKSIDDLRGAHNIQKVVFILGTSGSLAEIDLSVLTNYPTIGLNHFLQAGKNPPDFVPNYLLWVDMGVLQNEMKRVLNTPSVKLIVRSRLAEKIRNTCFNGECYSFDVSPDQQSVLKVKGLLQQVNNTAHYAIEVAHRMIGTVGPGKIVLLGIDMFYPQFCPQCNKQLEDYNCPNCKKKFEAHFFGTGEKEGCKPNFARVISFMHKTAGYLKKRRIEFVTCSPWKGPLSKLLDQKPLSAVLSELV